MNERAAAIWFWPTGILLLLVGLSTAVPGGLESSILLGVVGLQAAWLAVMVAKWFVDEARARSAQ